MIPLSQLWLPARSFSELLTSLEWFRHAYQLARAPALSLLEHDSV